MVRKVVVFILIFIASISIVKAEQDIDLINFFKNNDKISVNNTDKSYCSGKQEAGIYALPTSIEYPYTKTEIDKIQSELDNAVIDTKSETSVNAYNSKLDKLHDMINTNNETVKKLGIPVNQYCKPYNCNRDFPGTIYEKSTDKCICEDGKEFDSIENKCPIDEIILPTRQNIQINEDLSIHKDNLYLRIILVFLGLAVAYFVFKD